LFLPGLSPGYFSQLPALPVASSGEAGIMIEDIAVVSPSRLLVSDHINTLRLVDSVDGGNVSCVCLPSVPDGVCLLRDGLAAVTQRLKQQIQFIRVDGDTLSLDKSIKVKGPVIGISACDSHLVVTYDRSVGVETITLDGRVIDEMDNKKAGKQVFKHPYYITTTSSGDIFVSDCGNRTIIQMDRTLRITRTFSSPMLKKPRGIVSVGTDQLLVADQEGNSIVVLNPTNGTVTPLLGQADGIQKPWAVAWCPDSKKLYVGSDKRQSTLSVFKERIEH